MKPTKLGFNSKPPVSLKGTILYGDAHMVVGLQVQVLRFPVERSEWHQYVHIVGDHEY